MPTKKRSKPIRSIEQSEAIYFPESVTKAQEEERLRHPEKFGTGLIDDLMKYVRALGVPAGMLQDEQGSRAQAEAEARRFFRTLYGDWATPEEDEAWKELS